MTEMWCPTSDEALLSRKRKKKWKKILYEKQEYEDNYVDERFLEELVTNANVRTHDYWSLVQSSATLTQQLCTVLIFFGVFIFMREGYLSVQSMAALDVVSMIVAYGVFKSFDKSVQTKFGGDLKTGVRTCLLFTSTLAIFSPILRTLTQSYAEDTIWALAISLSVLHLFSHDYSYVNTGTEKFIGTISLNAAVFTSVLLASRLKKNEQVFAFMLFAIELFALCPIARHVVRQVSVRLHVIMTLAFIVVASAVMYPISITVVVILNSLIVLITFVCPLWLFSILEYKREIQGPWDIARVKEMK